EATAGGAVPVRMQPPNGLLPRRSSNRRWRWLPTEPAPPRPPSRAAGPIRPAHDFAAMSAWGVSATLAVMLVKDGWRRQGKGSGTSPVCEREGAFAVWVRAVQHL